MTLETFNNLPREDARLELEKCCGASGWVSRMMDHFPFRTDHEMLERAKQIWDNECSENDWLEAFRHHPKIGDIDSLQKKFASTSAWAGSEQAAVKSASPETIHALAKANDEYEKKFGFIFIVCATGKSAEEMLDFLHRRMNNDYDTEIRIAAEEQKKITQLRLQKLLS